MSKQVIQPWLSSPSVHSEDNEEIIWVSKSALKRDADILKNLGIELVELSKNTLERIPLDDELRDAILLAQKIKKEGRRRQLQLIGKMLRRRDPLPIQAALDKLKNHHHQQVVFFHTLEQLRDQLIAQGDEAIPAILALYPQADRQQLRALARNAKKEQLNHQTSKSARQIFHYLRTLSKAYN